MSWQYTTPDNVINEPEGNGLCEHCGHEVERNGTYLCTYCSELMAVDLYKD